jgi:hypothetical protein
MTKAVALTVVVLAACSTHPREREYTGIYVSAFEVSSFRPCGTQERWWLTDASGSLANRLLAPVPPQFERSAFLRVRASLSRSGSYGHLSSYTHELTVTETLDVSADTSAVCP